MSETDEFDLIAMVPTKDRPEDLRRTLAALSRLRRLPQEVIVVDQSGDECSAEVTQQVWERSVRLCAEVRLRHDRAPEINGVPAARNHAIALAEASPTRPGRRAVWWFLDDDVEMAPDFSEKLLAAYRGHPFAAGISGVITNYPPAPRAARAWNALFRRGPFHDPRQPIYWRAHAGQALAARRVGYFTGAAMSFRAEVLCGFRNPDARPGCPRDEDVCFCEEVARRLAPGQYFLVAPAARLAHYRSPVACDRDDWLGAEIEGMRHLYRTYWRRGWWSRVCYGWLRVGYGVLSARARLRRPRRAQSAATPLARMEGPQ